MRDAFLEADEEVEGYCTKDYPEWPIENSAMCPNGANKDIIWGI